MRAQDAITGYQNRVWRTGSTYVITANAPNSRELMIIEVLRKAYSKHPSFNPNLGNDISQKTLFEGVLKKARTWYRIFKYQLPFSDKMLETLGIIFVNRIQVINNNNKTTDES